MIMLPFHFSRTYTPNLGRISAEPLSSAPAALLNRTNHCW
jgi:hypothetical protein